jgi:hypothetical protein
MNEQQLLALRRDPSPEFASRLRATLGRDAAPVSASPHRGGRKAVIWSAVAVAIALSFTLPAVRASAQSFLSLFRVVNFVAVRVEPGRAAAIQQLDLEQLIGDRIQVVKDPGEPLPMTSVEQAAAAAGLDLRLPAWLPEGTRIDQIAVSGERQAIVTADSARLRGLMDTLGINDLQVPDGLDGQQLTVRVPPIVMIRYLTDKAGTRFFQARTPEVTAPTGVSLAALGEIGLRLLGLSADDARAFAGRIDWNTTMLVPLPPMTSSLRPVDINGTPGISAEFDPPNGDTHTTIVLWSDDGRVFGLMSILHSTRVMEIASSIK